MNEGALELTLAWLDESYAVPLLTALVVTLTAFSAAWRRSVRRVHEATAPRHWLIDGAHRLIAVHDRVYSAIAGHHPQRRIWHCQWLPVKDLYRDLGRRLPTFTHRVADVGCMGKPYAIWLTNATLHFGLDVTPGPSVDLVVREGEPWAIASESFDAAICTQVMQVAKNPEHLLAELERILVPGGHALITAPFAYHDMTFTFENRVHEDYWRYSFYGLQQAVGENFEIVECWRQGGFGSVAGSMILNWVRISLTRRLETHLLFIALAPAWLLFCVLVNVSGWLLDKIDCTGAFYQNSVVVVRKKPVSA